MIKKLHASFLKTFTCIAFLFGICTQAANAQDGIIDPSFNSADIGNGEGAGNTVTAITVLPDGKTLIAGGFFTYNGEPAFCMARLNTDGTRDLSFNATGVRGPVTGICVQPDGKIFIGGSGDFNGAVTNGIYRINADGTADAGFPALPTIALVNALVLQPDGKLIAGGAFFNFAGYNRLVRLNPDGTVDTGFSTDGPNSEVKTVALQADGKIIIGGIFTFYNSIASPFIVRLNADGTREAGFITTGANGQVNCITIQSDGKILIGGSFSTYNGFAAGRITRLNVDGTKDGSFIGNGTNGTVNTISLQGDGKIITGGSFSTFNSANASRILRLNPDGSTDPGFILTGTIPGLNNTCTATAVQSDGKILLGGIFTTYNSAAASRITRVNADGTKDTGFFSGMGANNTVNAMVRQPDGKIIIVGTFDAYNGVSAGRITRVNTDGSKDATFNSSIGANNTINTLALQPDGKILIGGIFTAYDAVAVNRITRLNADGTRDATFTGTGADGTLSAIKLQPDGKILIGGNFANYGSTPASRFCRLNADGTFDLSFITGSGTNAVVNVIALQTDGKILIGGGFTTYNAVGARSIARLNTNGMKDATFNTGTGFNSSVFCLAIQTDGKILAGGAFTTYNGLSALRMTRLDTDGLLDPIFSVMGPNGTVSAMAVQPDEKIVIGGMFGLVGTNTANRITRLYANGTQDAGFTGTGASGNVIAITLQPDGKILAGGVFTAYNGTGRNRLARIIGTSAVVPLKLLTFTGTQNGKLNLLQWKTTDEINSSFFDVERSTDGRSFSKTGSVTATGSGSNSYSFNHDAPAVINYYRLKIVDLNGRFNFSNIIKLGAQNSAAISCYPNPVQQTLNIVLNNAALKGTVAQLTDLSGKTIKTISFQKMVNSINVAELPAGIYFLRTEAGEVVKIVKE